MMKIKNNKKGFTLIELMVVIAIIGFMSAVILASINTARIKARDTQRIAELRNIEKAMNLYALSNNGIMYSNGFTSWSSLALGQTSSTICGNRGGQTVTLFNVLKNANTLVSVPNPDPMASKGYCYLHVADTTGRYVVVATALEGRKNNNGTQSVAGVIFGNIEQDWVNINLTTGKTSLASSSPIGF